MAGRRTAACFGDVFRSSCRAWSGIRAVEHYGSVIVACVPYVEVRRCNSQSVALAAQSAFGVVADNLVCLAVAILVSYVVNDTCIPAVGVVAVAYRAACVAECRRVAVGITAPLTGPIPIIPVAAGHTGVIGGIGLRTDIGHKGVGTGPEPGGACRYIIGRIEVRRGGRYVVAVVASVAAKAVIVSVHRREAGIVDVQASCRLIGASYERAAVAVETRQRVGVEPVTIIIGDVVAVVGTSTEGSAV